MTSHQLFFTSTADELGKAHAGIDSEDVFFDIAHCINQDPHKPSWLYRIDRATLYEDMCGIDAIARTDLGEAPIQIKSSYRGARLHEFKYPLFWGIVVTVYPTASSRIEEAASAIIEGLSDLYEDMNDSVEH